VRPVPPHTGLRGGQIDSPRVCSCEHHKKEQVWQRPARGTGDVIDVIDDKPSGKFTMRSDADRLKQPQNFDSAGFTSCAFVVGSSRLLFKVFQDPFSDADTTMRPDPSETSIDRRAILEKIRNAGGRASL